MELWNALTRINLSGGESKCQVVEVSSHNLVILHEIILPRKTSKTGAVYAELNQFKFR